jgi:hypothetical protein
VMAASSLIGATARNTSSGLGSLAASSGTLIPAAWSAARSWSAMKGAGVRGCRLTAVFQAGQAIRIILVWLHARAAAVSWRRPVGSRR